MRRPLPKRFYERAETGERDGAHHILLDGRAVKTPGKNPLGFASPAAAQLIADEFAAQGEEINPATMPCYRLANTAIDGVASDMQAVLEDVLRYCGGDMLYYRAGSPQELADRQRRIVGTRSSTRPRGSPARASTSPRGSCMSSSRARRSAAIGVHLDTVTDPVVLAAIHSMTTLPRGSALLALAVWKGELSAERPGKPRMSTRTGTFPTGARTPRRRSAGQPPGGDGCGGAADRGAVRLEQPNPFIETWPSLPMMMWSWTVMPSGLAVSMIVLASCRCRRATASGRPRGGCGRG